MIVLALAIGLLSALAGYVLHLLIHCIQGMLGVASGGAKLLVYPIIGITLTMLFVRIVVKDKISHGITRVLQAISSNNSYIRGHNTWSSVVASSITIGFGGSVGAEAPIVLTGSAIGSALGRWCGMDRKTMMVLVGCGAAAAIAGVFKAPIAGLVFTLEVLMIDLSMSSIMPILIASVTATCCSYALGGGEQLCTFEGPVAWKIDKVPANIELGVFCGLVSVYFIRSMTVCERMYSLMKTPWVKLLIGGVLLSVMIYFFPQLYGEGYIALGSLLTNDSDGARLTIVALTMIVLLKPIATASTNGAGGCGGTFAPSLVVGGFAGFLFAMLWNGYVQPLIPTPTIAATATVLLGMAGVMAGVMHAPLTGVFLIAELTGGYSMFMPLMIVCLTAVLVISLFEKHSIYASRLARQGRLVTHHTDQSVLTLMSLESVVEQCALTLRPEQTLGEMVRTIANAEIGYYPVVDAGGRLLGEVELNGSRHVMFRTELYARLTVAQVMTPARYALTTSDTMQTVMDCFERSSADYLPVVEGDRLLLGCLSRTRVYEQYRKMVADFSNE